MKEMCRRCKDSDVQREADGIVWGKLCPPDALGPRCFDCISEQLGYYAEMSVRKRDHQWAIYPLPVPLSESDVEHKLTRRADDVSGDRMVRMSAEARALLPELWRGLPMEQRDVLAAMVDDYDADHRGAKDCHEWRSFQPVVSAWDDLPNGVCACGQPESEVGSNRCAECSEKDREYHRSLQRSAIAQDRPRDEYGRFLSGPSVAAREADEERAMWRYS